jgi:hypothetical protein
MELVKMTKSHVVADVHPDMVEHYEEHGWVKVAEQVQAEDAKPVAKKKAK